MLLVQEEEDNEVRVEVHNEVRVEVHNHSHLNLINNNNSNNNRGELPEIHRVHVVWHGVNLERDVVTHLDQLAGMTTVVIMIMLCISQEGISHYHVVTNQARHDRYVVHHRHVPMII